MSDQMVAMVDWRLYRVAFESQVDKIIQEAKAKGKVIPLPISPSLETLIMLLSQVNCSNCDAICCREGMPGNEAALAPGELKALAKEYGDKGFTGTPPGGGINLTCRFLQGKQCRIHDHRPLSCMVFPMQGSGEVASDFGAPKRNALAVASLCPEGRRIAKAVYMTTWELKQKYWSIPSDEALAILRGEV